jgi:RNA polymerase sigma-70 factor, ECF subfamily
MMIPDVPVADMLRHAQGGDVAALGVLLERFRPYLTLLARLQIGRRLQGKVDADDAVQETFLKVYRDFPAFRGGGEAELVAWLRQILSCTLANVVRHYCGTDRRDVRLERDLLEELDRSSQMLDRALFARQSSPSQLAARHEEAVLLAGALERLPEDYGEVLVLRHLEGLSFPEVAERLGRTLDSVKNLWARAVPRLRRALGDAP